MTTVYVADEGGKGGVRAWDLVLPVGIVEKVRLEN